MFCQPGYNFFMQELDSSPYNYLEIGVFNGDSIAGLARTYPNKVVYAIDPFIEDGATINHSGVQEDEFMPTQRENTMNHIHGLENITLFELLSRDFSNILTDEMVSDMNVGHVLIDGSHHYDDVIVDVNLAMRLIGNKSGSIVFDDLNLPGVAKAHSEFLKLYQDKITSGTDIYNYHPGRMMAYKIN